MPVRRNVAIALFALIACAGLAAFALIRQPTEQPTPEADPFWRSFEPLVYGTAAGHVRESESGSGIYGVPLAVEAIGSDGEVWPMGVRSGEGGRFTLASIASSGSYRVTASAPGYEPDSEAFVLKPRRFTIVELTLKRQ